MIVAFATLVNSMLVKKRIWCRPKRTPPSRHAPSHSFWVLPKIDPSHAADYSASSISWQRRRIGEIEDTAACALYLTSPAASRVTGKTFEVDGGAENPALEVPTPPL
jgi:NAD(P)-dependent dehydrogenase (short-subunit alcohol dehydrogenase family)